MTKRKDAWQAGQTAILRRITITGLDFDANPLRIRHNLKEVTS